MRSGGEPQVPGEVTASWAETCAVTQGFDLRRVPPMTYCAVAAVLKFLIIF